MATYNGHRSWAAWNVALWIGNDEGLYRLALDCIKSNRNVDLAAKSFVRVVGTDKTPDGAKYTVTSVAEAMKGLE